MVLFFMLIALELKREVREEQLATGRTIATPAFAAIGGMVAPAVIYLLLNAGNPAAIRGWAIPTATDAVLALTVLVLLGNRVPASLKIFLTALAGFDDIGAILIIAFFYTDAFALPPILLASAAIIALIGLNRWNVSRLAPYVVIGVFLWVVGRGSRIWHSRNHGWYCYWFGNTNGLCHSRQSRLPTTQC